MAVVGEPLLSGDSVAMLRGVDLPMIIRRAPEPHQLRAHRRAHQAALLGLAVPSRNCL